MTGPGGRATSAAGGGEFDETIHAPQRLRITAILATVDSADFATVRDAVGLSDSALSKHASTLEGVGYVRVSKGSIGGRNRTSLALTPAGRAAYAGHLAALRQIVGEGAS